MQRGINAQSIDDDEDEFLGFRAILKRHKRSQQSHVQRMRGNLPSAQSARPLRESAVIANNQEQVQRIKNELAIQRAIRYAVEEKYRPSPRGIKELEPYKNGD